MHAPSFPLKDKPQQSRGHVFDAPFEPRTSRNLAPDLKHRRPDNVAEQYETAKRELSRLRTRGKHYRNGLHANCASAEPPGGHLVPMETPNWVSSNRGSERDRIANRKLDFIGCFVSASFYDVCVFVSA